MWLNSHMVDSGSSLRPGGLKITLGICVSTPKIPEGEWVRDVACHPPEGAISLFPSHSISISLGADMPYGKNFENENWI